MNDPLMVRRPVVGAALTAGVLGLVALSVLASLPVAEFFTRYAAVVADDPVRFVTAIGLTAFVGAWIPWSAVRTRTTSSKNMAIPNIASR